MRRLSLRKRAVFALLILLVLIGIGEGICRLFGLGKSEEMRTRSRGFSTMERSFIVEEGREGRAQVRTKRMPEARFNREILNPATFSLHPDPGVKRIMLFGGSAVYGWPYSDSLSLASWLRAGLPALAGGDRVEILNFGAPGYGSLRVANLVDEALAFHPHMIFVLTGHNELLEAGFAETVPTGPLMDLHLLLLNHSRLYSALEGVMGPGLPARKKKPPGLPATYEPRRAEELTQAFRSNLMRIHRACRERDVEVVFATMAANLRDVPPVGAFPPASFDLASEEIPRALEQRTSDALLHYRYGLMLYRMGRYSRAGDHFQKACDFDPVGLRVTSALNAVVEEVSEQDGAGLLPLREWFAEASPHGVPGGELFLDHCHPTIEVHERLAAMIAGFIRDRGVVQAGEGWEESFRERVRIARERSPLTDEDRFRYWQFMAVFHSLHKNGARVRECQLRMMRYKASGSSREAGR